MNTEPHPLKFASINDPEIRDAAARVVEAWKKELTTGAVSIRWIQSVAGYKLYARGKPMLGTESFPTPAGAIAWAKERLGIDLSNARVIE